MRQRLINKTEPQENSSLLRSSSDKNTIVDEAISLQSLLFDNTNSKENWIEGIKYHSKNVTNLLLNNQIDAFNEYLRSQFGGEVPEINPTADFSGEKAFQVKKGLENLDYRPILQDLLQTAILIEHSTIPPYKLYTFLYPARANFSPIFSARVPEVQYRTISASFGISYSFLISNQKYPVCMAFFM